MCVVFAKPSSSEDEGMRERLYLNELVHSSPWVISSNARNIFQWVSRFSSSSVRDRPYQIEAGLVGTEGD